MNSIEPARHQAVEHRRCEHEEASSLSAVYDMHRLRELLTLRNEPVQVYRTVLAHIVSRFGGVSGCLAVRTEAGEFEIVTGIGLPAEAIGNRIRPGEGVLGWVAAQGEAVVLNGDVSDDPRFRGLKARAGGRRPVSAMCWPLLIEDRVGGVLSVNRADAASAFTAEDLEQGGVVVNVVAVVLENTRLHVEQQRQIGYLKAWGEAQKRLNQADAIVRQSADLGAFYRQIVNDAAAICRARYAAFAVYNADGTLRRFVTHGVDEEQARRIGAPPTGKGLLSTLYHQAEPLRVDDIAKDPRACGFPPGHPPMRNLLGLPLMSGGRRRGVIYLADREDGKPFGEQDELLLSMYADEVMKVFDRIDLLHALQTANQSLKREQAEQQALIQKLQDAQAQLLQSEKLASIGQLAAGVAHEINNPVGYVNSNLGSLEKYLKDLFDLIAAYEHAEPLLAGHPEIAAAIQTLKQKADLGFLKEDTLALVNESREGIARVKKIVQDLKDFSHVDEADWQWADLHKGLDSTLNIVHNELKYKAEVVKEYGRLPEVECLPSQLNQVFMNMLVNAAHAIESRGTITVRTGTRDDQVYVAISDTGKGIAPEHLNRIFDPFFTTKPVGKGTGLGLSLAYGIVTKHGGRIEVDSTVGQGTTFTVWLPVRQGELRAAG